MPVDAIKKIKTDIEAILTGMDIELVDLEYRKENGQQVLRIFVHKEAGVDLNTCTMVSRAVKDFIDEQDVNYDYMEVSSPGIDRVLKKDRDFERFMGCKIRVQTIKQYSGARKIIGILKGINEQEITVETEEQEIVSIPRDMISVVRLKPDF